MVRFMVIMNQIMFFNSHVGQISTELILNRLPLSQLNAICCNSDVNVMIKVGTLMNFNSVL